jgi:hypothetical protein
MGYPPTSGRKLFITNRMRTFRNATSNLVHRKRKCAKTDIARAGAPVMSFIHWIGISERRIRFRRESDAPGARQTFASRPHGEERRRITRRGAWKVGGLAGAVVYSAVCWMLVYHGAQAALAWMKPEPTIEASAADAATQTKE